MKVNTGKPTSELKMYIARITLPGFIVDVEYGRQTPVFWTKNSSFNYLVQENDISTVYEISAKYHTPDSVKSGVVVWLADPNGIQINFKCSKLLNYCYKMFTVENKILY